MISPFEVNLSSVALLGSLTVSDTSCCQPHPNRAFGQATELPSDVAQRGMLACSNGEAQRSTDGIRRRL